MAITSNIVQHTILLSNVLQGKCELRVLVLNYSDLAKCSLANYPPQCEMVQTNCATPLACRTSAMDLLAAVLSVQPVAVAVKHWGPHFHLQGLVLWRSPLPLYPNYASGRRKPLDIIDVS
jgi:hypothetical protein